MKSRAIIAKTLRDWHSVDAARQAEATFDQLDQDEIFRLALRAFAEEWRSELRVKDEHGVPRYASIEVRGDAGEPVRLYKQTALFDVADYQIAVQSHIREAQSHLRAAEALASDARQRHGVQIAIPTLEAGAA